MKLISGITRFFYSIILTIIGVFLIMMALNLVPKEKLLETVSMVYITPNFRIGAGIAGLLLLAISLLVIQLALSKIQREKTIAFDNPDGQVTIALTAIENFMKAMIHQVPQIKELKPNIIAGKKGIIINVRVALYSDTNIPNIAETIQSIIKSRVQDMLGIEEAIIVKVHISKIIHRDDIKKNKKDKEQKEEGRYQGLEFMPD